MTGLFASFFFSPLFSFDSIFPFPDIPTYSIAFNKAFVICRAESILLLFITAKIMPSSALSFLTFFLKVSLHFVTVHSHILVGRFHACMKICLHECAKGAPFHEQKRAAKQRKALKARFCEWRRVNSNNFQIAERDCSACSLIMGAKCSSK